MYKHAAIVISFFLFSQSVAASNQDEAFESVDKIFLAVSQINHQNMKAQVTKDFILLEHGKVWTINDLINVVKPSKYHRTNYFSIINSTDYKNFMTINYWNKAIFTEHKSTQNNTQKVTTKTNSDTRQQVIQEILWLESVVLEKHGKNWLISQMHSTRLPHGHAPKDVKFVEQKQ